MLSEVNIGKKIGHLREVLFTFFKDPSTIRNFAIGALGLAYAAGLTASSPTDYLHNINSLGKKDSISPPAFVDFRPPEGSKSEPRGNKVAFLALIGQDLEFTDSLGNPYDDPFPKRSVDLWINELTNILETTPEKMTADGRLIILSPLGEPDTDYSSGQKILYDPKNQPEIIQKLTDIQLGLRNNNDIGRIVVYVFSHNGDGATYIGNSGLTYDTFNSYLAGFGQQTIVDVVIEDCFGASSLLPFFETNVHFMSNSLQSAQGFGHTHLTRITTSDNFHQAVVGYKNDFSKPTASETIAVEFANGGTIQEAFTRAAEKIQQGVNNIYTKGQRPMMRTTSGNLTSRIAGPDGLDIQNLPLGYLNNAIGADSLKLSLDRLVDGSIIARNFAENTTFVTILPSGSVQTLGPLQSTVVPSNTTSVTDSHSFKATLPDQAKWSDLNCPKTDFTALQTIPGALPDTILVPLANLCNRPVEVQMVYPAGLGSGELGI